MLRATRIASSGSSRPIGWSLPESSRSRRFDEVVEVVQPLAQVGVGRARVIRARVADCSFSTATSAASPLSIDASIRRTQPLSWANIR